MPRNIRFSRPTSSSAKRILPHLSIIEFRLLVITEKEDELNGRDVGKKYTEMVKKKFSYGSLYTSLSRLVKKELLTKNDSELDARYAIYRTTSKAYETIELMREHFNSLAQFGL